MSRESFVSAMGRLIAQNIAINLIGHFVLALIYGWVVATCIYRLHTGLGLVVGTLMALPLYGMNYLIFAAFLRYPSNELHVTLAHLSFCLFFSAAYKASSVPRPRWKDSGRPVEVG